MLYQKDFANIVVNKTSQTPLNIIIDFICIYLCFLERNELCQEINSRAAKKHIQDYDLGQRNIKFFNLR